MWLSAAIGVEPSGRSCAADLREKFSLDQDPNPSDLSGWRSRAEGSGSNPGAGENPSLKKNILTN